MVAVRVGEHVELFTILDKCVNHLQLILTVYIIICCASYDEVFTGQGGCVAQWAVVIISACVLLWSAHETLGVDRIVVSPISDGRNGNADLEDVALAKAECAHEAAEAPSPNAYS